MVVAVKGSVSGLAAAVLAFTGTASFAAGEFEGKWKVADTAGQPFEITLASDGTAAANRGEVSPVEARTRAGKH